MTSVHVEQHNPHVHLLNVMYCMTSVLVDLHTVQQTRDTQIAEPVGLITKMSRGHGPVDKMTTLLFHITYEKTSTMCILLWVGLPFLFCSIQFICNQINCYIFSQSEAPRITSDNWHRGKVIEVTKSWDKSIVKKKKKRHG